MSEAERRRATRIIHAFMVRYRSLASSSPSWLVSTLRDFSGTGARFLCERGFEVGEAMRMQLLLPTSPEPVALNACVVRTKPSPLGMVEVGVAFEPPDEPSTQALAGTVEFFLARQRGAA
jgi:c-di-GMP-binding flagellar brake protein YcgR